MIVQYAGMKLISELGVSVIALRNMICRALLVELWSTHSILKIDTPTGLSARQLLGTADVSEPRASANTTGKNKL